MSTQFVDVTADHTGSGSSSGWMRRWLTGPPGVLFTIVTALATVVTVVTYAVPGTLYTGFLLSLALWPAIGLAWLAPFVLNLVSRDPQNSWRRRPVAWLLAPAVVAALMGALLLQLPLRVGTMLAQSDAAEFASSSTAPVPTRIGPYPVHDVHRLDAMGMRFAVSGRGVVDSPGLAYRPGATLPVEDIGGIRYRQLGGAWYTWDEES